MYQATVFEWQASHGLPAWPVPHYEGETRLSLVKLRLEIRDTTALLGMNFLFGQRGGSAGQAEFLSKFVADLGVTWQAAGCVSGRNSSGHHYSFKLSIPPEECEAVDMWGMRKCCDLWHRCGHTDHEQMPIPRVIVEPCQDIVVDGKRTSVPWGRLLHARVLRRPLTC